MYEYNTLFNGIQLLFFNGLYTNNKTYNVYLSNYYNIRYKMDWVGLSLIFQFKTSNYKIDYIKRKIYCVIK